MDPELVALRDRYRAFMEAHVYPNEMALYAEDAAADALLVELRERARVEGLWAPHIGPEAGGTGRGFLAYAYLNEEIGRCFWAQLIFGCQAPDAGNSEILEMFGTPQQRDRLPRAAGPRRRALLLRDDRARGLGLRSDRAADARGAGRRRVGHRRRQVVPDRRRRRRVRHRHGRHRSRRRAAPSHLADHRAGRHAGRGGRAAGARPRSHGARLEHALRSAVPRCARAGVEPARRARRRLPDRPEAPRSGPHPPRHALARPDAARVRPDVHVRAAARGVRVAAGRQADDAELDRRLGRRDPGLPADDARTPPG